MTDAGATSRGTSSQILDIAERLVQTRGFNGFSYADIAAEMGLTKATLHYHFRTKAELGKQLIARYNQAFRAALDAIDAEDPPAPERLRQYARLYADVLHGGRMCLCGMLAAEYQSIPAPMQEELRAFFDFNEAWLEKVIEDGRASRTIRGGAPAADTARLLLSSLEGAMLVARPYADVARFEASAQRLVAEITAPPGPEDRA